MKTITNEKIDMYLLIYGKNYSTYKHLLPIL